METKDLNRELKDEVNKIFTSLFREIGSNRQQLASKVLSHQTEIYKELSKEEAGDERRKEILSEVARTVKMAHQQLPHLKMNPPRPASPPPAAKPRAEKPAKPVAPPAKAMPIKTPPAPAAKVAPKGTAAKAKQTAKKTASKPAKKKK